jgi:alpha-1,3-fucosyltransferase
MNGKVFKFMTLLLMVGASFYLYIMYMAPMRENFLFSFNFGSECSPFLPLNRQFYIKINNITYPQIVPLHFNKSINFTCLNEPVVDFEKRKRILIWNSFKAKPFQSPDTRALANCPVNNCDITYNRKLANISDLILIHLRSYLDVLPPQPRPTFQRWVYSIVESPHHCAQCLRYEGLFNLSLTYLQSSDFSSVYYTDAKMYWTENKVKALSNNNDTRKLAFALMSNCDDHLKRKDYVKYVNESYSLLTNKNDSINIYGKCADDLNYKCANYDHCNRSVLSNKYKFYFAFENSYCNDYVTEKFFDSLRYRAVPIVMGAGDYTKYAPKYESFIFKQKHIYLLSLNSFNLDQPL